MDYNVIGENKNILLIELLGYTEDPISNIPSKPAKPRKVDLTFNSILDVFNIPHERFFYMEHAVLETFVERLTVVPILR